MFGTQNPDHPWGHIAARVTERIVGFGRPLLPDVRMAMVTPPATQGARHHPLAVGSGELDLAITTPAATAWMAARGSGVYDRPVEGLRAIATYPHPDFLVFAVDAATGITSFEELVERRHPLRLVTGRSRDGVHDVLTAAVEEVLRQYGASYAAIEEWGGEVHFAGPTHTGGKLLLDGAADALFQEDQNSLTWQRIADSRPVNFLPVSPRVQEAMRETFGFPSATIPQGYARSVEAPVPTVDFGGWLLFCRDDLPSEWAYALAQACEETRDEVAQGDADKVQRALDLPIDAAGLFAAPAIPLHEGAAAYARERGYLDE
jgi:TRAP-type uncharacterized transport system substrate-binding protein